MSIHVEDFCFFSNIRNKIFSFILHISGVVCGEKIQPIRLEQLSGFHVWYRIRRVNITIIFVSQNKKLKDPFLRSWRLMHQWNNLWPVV